MKRVFPLLLLLAACAAPPPAPKAVPEQPAQAPGEERVIGTVRVTATALNVRADASTDADVIVLAKRGEKFSLLKDGGDWLKVKLPSGKIGWVSAQHVSREGARKTARKRSGSCPPDADFAFVKTPMLSFSDRPKPGMVVVDATVNTNGDVVATKIVSNSTGDETLAFLTEREIKLAKFTAPIRNCVPRTFIFTYKRTF